MKTIFQETQTAFQCIDFQDAIIMLPIMDMLANDRLNINKRLEEARADEKAEWRITELEEKLLRSDEQLRVMLKLGFAVSDPGKLQGLTL